jgi:hypothetical protein
MKFAALLILLLLCPHAHADDSDDESDRAINKCIKQWKTSPFKAGAEADLVINPSVKVLGIGKNPEDNKVTSGPNLVLVKPNVNVLGKSTFRLMNPNGWYCFKANVSVLGKIAIEADCKAHLATSTDGANVLGADDSQRGTSVLGSIRVTRIGACAKNDEEKSEKSDRASEKD